MNNSTYNHSQQTYTLTLGESFEDHPTVEITTEVEKNTIVIIWFLQEIKISFFRTSENLIFVIISIFFYLNLNLLRNKQQLLQNLQRNQNNSQRLPRNIPRNLRQMILNQNHRQTRFLADLGGSNDARMCNNGIYNLGTSIHTQCVRTSSNVASRASPSMPAPKHTQGELVCIITLDRKNPRKKIIKIGFGPKQASKPIQTGSKQGSSGAHILCAPNQTPPDHDSSEKAYDFEQKQIRL